MLNYLKPAVLLLLLLTLLTGVIYPLVVTAFAQLFYADKANGSLIYDTKGQAVGSALIGQSFTQAKYFWGRASATAPYPYNASASSGSNLGPTNPALMEAVNARVKTLQAAEPSNKAAVPVDLVTASGSGLDPHISLNVSPKRETWMKKNCVNWSIHRLKVSNGLSWANPELMYYS